ncbi:hypothetical protein ACJX0J_033413, partial [Zea mays]
TYIDKVENRKITTSYTKIHHVGKSTIWWSLTFNHVIQNTVLSPFFVLCANFIQFASADEVTQSSIQEDREPNPEQSNRDRFKTYFKGAARRTFSTFFIQLGEETDSLFLSTLVY